MVSQPRFANHNEQKAMLGCAAHLDPDKHPRRYAIAKARARMEGEDIAIMDEPEEDGPRTILDSRREHAGRQDAERRALAMRASWYSDLSMKQAAEALGISYEKIKKLKSEFSLSFRPGYIGKPRKTA
jgi:hypothetical protein